MVGLYSHSHPSRSPQVLTPRKGLMVLEIDYKQFPRLCLADYVCAAKSGNIPVRRAFTHSCAPADVRTALGYKPQIRQESIRFCITEALFLSLAYISCRYVNFQSRFHPITSHLSSSHPHYGLQRYSRSRCHWCVYRFTG